MPTYNPLQSVTLSVNTSTVSFTGIDQTYEDLEIVINARTSHSSNCNFYYRINSDTSSSYSVIRLQGNGSTVVSNTGTSNTVGYIGYVDAADSAVGIFGTTKIIINNYSNSTTNKMLFSKGATPGASGYSAAFASLYRGSTSPITSISFTPDAGNWVAGSTFSLYGISPVNSKIAAASGGTDIFYDSSYVYHVFKDTGTFTPTRALTVDYLVIAGGGGGGIGSGGGQSGGGGGAGGLRSTVTATGGGGTLGTALSLASGTNYTVTVGAGGSGNTNGNNSVFSSITSTGGGAGGNSGGQGATGGSGGGSSAGSTGYAGANGTTNQGYAGGSSVMSPQNNYISAGGGGAGGAGANGTTGGTGGAGGVGLQLTAWSTATGTGVSNYYAGGGGGGVGQFAGATISAGSLGGGGYGGYTNPSAIAAASGVTNTGSGGGGGNSNTDGRPFTAGNGGSGIVIVRYAR